MSENPYETPVRAHLVDRPEDAKLRILESRFWLLFGWLMGLSIAGVWAFFYFYAQMGYLLQADR